MIFHLKLSVKKDSPIDALQGIRELFILLANTAEMVGGRGLNSSISDVFDLSSFCGKIKFLQK
jgi:hypothetical protein